MEAWGRRGVAAMTVLQAPLGAIDQIRRPLRVGHVLVTLEQLAIVTWPIAEATLRAHLPASLRPVVRNGHAFVSAALFHNRALRPAILGVPRIASFQMNVRSYVFDPVSGEPDSVFFHGLFLSRRWLVALSSRLFGVRFQHLPLTVATRHEGDRVAKYEARSTDDRVNILARETDQAIDPEMLDFLTNPHTGYVLGRDDVLRCWSIWHLPQNVHTMAVNHAMVAPVAALGVGEARWAFYVRSVDYEVYLPPTAAMKRSLMAT
jgi:uncharacterized protein YqjF (DUF2071 family)